MSQKAQDDRQSKAYPWTARHMRHKQGNRLSRKQARKLSRGH